MPSSLLALRLQRKTRARGPIAEPALRTGSTCVAALWECGCAAVGPNFERLTPVPCLVHDDFGTPEPAFAGYREQQAASAERPQLHALSLR